MDNRTALEKNEHLVFPGLECVISAPAGRGSGVLAYTGYYHDREDPRIRHHVLIRELFPYDPLDGIRRAENGDLVIDRSSEKLYARYRESFLCANEVHSRMSEEIPGDLDLHINTYSLHNTLYSVMGCTGGRSLEQETELLYAKASSDPVSSPQKLLQIIQIIRGALLVLRAFHETGLLHLDVSPDNILLIGDGERERVTLIDFNSVHSIKEIRENGSIVLSRKDGYTSPEVRLGQRMEIGPQSDLYSMTAVLWHCLFGRRLSDFEQLVTAPPDPASLQMWQQLPSTVLSMLRRVLRKGLSPSPKRRYRSADEMLADLHELEERVIGRGITRWALWENGRARFFHLLEENISLQYIRDDSRIYPLFVETEDDRRLKLPDLTDTESALHETESGALSAKSCPLLILGGGGMGKTTALFRLAWSAYAGKKEYREDAAAVYYISLYGYRDGGDHFLRDSLLEGLKFKPETDSMESARRELMQLLDRAEAPVLYLLLDGFNEAFGDTAALLDEIRLFDAMPGARILMTSRSDPGDPLFSKISLCRLDPPDIRRILSDEGILPPENLEVFDLLGFPILLSIYIRSVKDRETNPGSLQSKEQLLHEYFTALRKKEAASQPQDSRETSGYDAVFQYLLPEIAAQIHRCGTPVTDAELMVTVESCYRELSGRALTAVYPQWIGKTSTLRLGAENADDWYGRAILDILHKRTGLLVRDEQGRMRILHQIMEDYLADKSLRFHAQFDRVKRRQRRRWRIAASAAVLLLVSLFGIYNYHMRRQIEEKHSLMLRSETEMKILEAVRTSEDALSSGDRREALDSAVDAVLLSCADQEQAGQVLLEEDGLALLRDDLPMFRERLLSCGSGQPRDTMADGFYTAQARKALTDALYVYELPDGYRPETVLHLPSHLSGLCLSPEGTRLGAVCAWDLAVFDIETGAETDTIPISETGTTDAVFAGDDILVYTGPQAICAYDLPKKKTLWDGRAATRLAVSGDQRRIAALKSGEHRAYIYDAASGETVRTIGLSEQLPAEPDSTDDNDQKSIPLENSLFCLNTDASMLAAGFSDGSVTLYDLAEGSAYILGEKTPDPQFEKTPNPQYEGGFCGDFLAWSVYDGDKTACFLADSVTHCILEQYLVEGKTSVTADTSGICVRSENGVYMWLTDKNDKPDQTAAEQEGSAVLSDAGLFDKNRSFRKLSGPAQEKEFDFFETAGEFAARGNRDSESVQILKKYVRQEAETVAYDPSYPHTHAGISADCRTLILYSGSGFRILLAESGEIICERELPDADTVRNTKFLRDEEGTRLEVLWADGTVRRYDAADGTLLSQEKRNPPDPAQPQEFVTDRFLLSAAPQKGTVIYDRETGDNLGEFDVEADLLFAAQAGEYIVISYYMQKNDSCFGFLLDDNFEILADLPDLCDCLDGELYFDCAEGSLRKSPIYSLPELLDLAVN